MKLRVLSIALLSLGVALSGCAGDDGGDTPTPGQVSEEDLGTQGAISGLLVDDRFRPIELTDSPQTEFQASGFVLLQETGDQVQTTENGEFEFVGLDPGSYTLRVQIEGHEASPARVTVEEGRFAEQTIVARRVLSTGGAILTQEYSMFIDCAVDYIANGGNPGCTLDGDPSGYSSAFDSDYTALTDMTVMVTEFLANQDTGYEIQIRPYANPNYATANIIGDYAKITNVVGEANTEHVNEIYDGPNVVFDNSEPFQTIMFVDHQTLKGVVPGTCCGVGATFGVKGQFLQSVFIGEPEVDVAAYCGLC